MAVIRLKSRFLSTCSYVYLVLKRNMEERYWYSMPTWLKALQNLTFRDLICSLALEDDSYSPIRHLDTDVLLPWLGRFDFTTDSIHTNLFWSAKTFSGRRYTSSVSGTSKRSRRRRRKEGTKITGLLGTIWLCDSSYTTCWVCVATQIN